VRIIGIDPGTASTGFGVIDSEAGEDRAVHFGVISTAAGQDLELRLLAIHRQLGELMDALRPEACAVEELFFGRNTRSAISVAQARGAALLAAAQHGLRVNVYRPLQVKQAVASYGGASKDQVQHMVRLLLRLDAVPQPDDAADALAIALCHAHSSVGLARLRAAQLA